MSSPLLTSGRSLRNVTALTAPLINAAAEMLWGSCTETHLHLAHRHCPLWQVISSELSFFFVRIVLRHLNSASFRGMSTSLDDHVSHGALLTDSLQRLQSNSSSDIPKNGDVYGNDINGEPRLSSPSSKSSRLITSIVHEGYGFRPTSGASTPPRVIATHGPESPLPDPNGLGWPGRRILFY